MAESNFYLGRLFDTKNGRVTNNRLNMTPRI